MVSFRTPILTKRWRCGWVLVMHFAQQHNPWVAQLHALFKSLQLLRQHACRCGRTCLCSVMALCRSAVERLLLQVAAYCSCQSRPTRLDPMHKKEFTRSFICFIPIMQKQCKYWYIDPAPRISQVSWNFREAMLKRKGHMIRTKRQN